MGSLQMLSQLKFSYKIGHKIGQERVQCTSHHNFQVQKLNGVPVLLFPPMTHKGSSEPLGLVLVPSPETFLSIPADI